jgi:predicted small lipoprotein YifL
MKSLTVLSILTLLAACGGKEPGKSLPAAPAAAAVQAGGGQLAAEGGKNALPDGGWFTWNFSEKPKLGMVVVKVRLFDKNGAAVKNCEVVGESGMPSMRYHDSGKVKFQLNKKGDYLLPVDVVMPGEWQVTIRLNRDGKEIYAGKVVFSV